MGFFLENHNHPATLQQQDNYDTAEQADQEDFYSPGLTFTTLTSLCVYLSVGAYAYSRAGSDLSLVDALFDCFALLTTSKLPDLFTLDLDKRKTDPIGFYQTLKANPSKNFVDALDPSKLPMDSWEMIAIQALYLLCGLNLISMCSSFAWRWFAGSEDNIESLSTYEQPTSLQENNCNGQIPNPDVSNNYQHSNNGFQQVDGLEAKTLLNEQYVVQTGMTQIEPTNDILTNQQQQQQQINLAELYVIGQSKSPADLSHQHDQQQQQYQHRHHLHNQQTSDVSFASDRSSSLCAHHAHQAQSPNVVQTPNSVCGIPVSSSLYGFNHGFDSHHTAQNKLFLPAPGQQNSLLLGQAGVSNDGDDDDDDGGADEDDARDMQRMLNACLQDNNAKLQSSSSSIHLSHQSVANNHQHQVSHALPPTTANNGGFHDHHRHHHQLGRDSSTRLRQRPQVEAPNNNGSSSNGGYATQDSSINTIDTTTNSNTMSSSSSRTVKLPPNSEHKLRCHLPNGSVGFILEDSQ